MPGLIWDCSSSSTSKTGATKTASNQAAAKNQLGRCSPCCIVLLILLQPIACWSRTDGPSESTQRPEKRHLRVHIKMITLKIQVGGVPCVARITLRLRHPGFTSVM